LRMRGFMKKETLEDSNYPSKDPTRSYAMSFILEQEKKSFFQTKFDYDEEADDRSQTSGKAFQIPYTYKFADKVGGKRGRESWEDKKI